MTPRPIPLPVKADGIPESLKSEPRWVLWRYECRDRWTKVLYRPTTPNVRASSTEAATWGSFALSITAYQSGLCDGIGFVLGDGYVGFDVDHCVADGAPADHVLAHLRGLNTYTELSVSGTGVHSIARGEKPGTRCRKDGYELYSSGRFFTVTGHCLPDLPATVEERTEDIAFLYWCLFGRDSAPRPEVPMPAIASVAHVPDDVLLARAVAASNGAKFSALWGGDFSVYASHSEADLALCSLLAFWTGRDAARINRLFRRSGLMRDKWDSRRGDTTYGGQVIAHAVQTATDVYQPIEHRVRRLSGIRRLSGLRSLSGLRGL